MVDDRRILIAGTGALATYFAACLAKSGFSVTMFGTWTQGLDALRIKGAQIIGQGRPHTVQILNEESRERFPLAFVLVKSWQTELAAMHLRTYLNEDGLAVTLQNGLGNVEILSLALGRSRVIGGVTTMGATLVGPGEVRSGGEGPIYLQKRPDVPEIIKVLQNAGFEIRKVPCIDSMIWGKLVVSAAVNPVTAILGIKNGGLLTLPAACALVKLIVSETTAVADAMQVKLPYQDAYKEVETVIQQTSGNYSSMLQDILRGSRTEIDAINGAIVELALSKNLIVPINQAVTSLIRALPGHGKIDG